MEIVQQGLAVIFASNCSFASPIGYQTNLVVMTPGNYRFIDFVRCGTPLILLVWVVFQSVRTVVLRPAAVTVAAGGARRSWPTTKGSAASTTISRGGCAR